MVAELEHWASTLLPHGGLEIITCLHIANRVPLWRGDDVTIKQLIEDFATYLYLPRLRDPDVLMAAVREGIPMLTWQEETFGYAQSKNASGRYLGLVAGALATIQVEGGALIVKSEVAAEQQLKDAEAAKRQAGRADADASSIDRTGVRDQPSGSGRRTPYAKTDTGGQTPTAAPIYRRFHGSVRLDSLRVARDAGRIADEVIQHLTKLVEADVEVTLEIQARLQEGASDKTVRDVRENCTTLKFESFDFEEE